MTPPGKPYNNDKIPLFWTATTPVHIGLIDGICQAAADDRALEPQSQLEHIRDMGGGIGDFVGWTPLQVASRYVMPELVDDKGVISKVFVIVDDVTVRNGNVLIVSIDWDSIEPGSEVLVDGTLRIEPSFSFRSTRHPALGNRDNASE